MKRRTNVWLDDDDRQNAQQVAAFYGLDSVSAALRFAVNELARQIRASAPPAPQAGGDAESDGRKTD